MNLPATLELRNDPHGILICAHCTCGQVFYPVHRSPEYDMKYMRSQWTDHCKNHADPAAKKAKPRSSKTPA